MSTHALGRLTVSVAGDTEERWLVISGRLDETALLTLHVNDWAARVVILDSAGIDFINSIGIREWMHFVALLVRAGAALIHDRCSGLLIEQMCFIPAVRGGGRVRSFHAPYLCERCGTESSELLDVEEHRAELASMRPPPMACGRCQAPMELADPPERLFAFMREPTRG